MTGHEDDYLIARIQEALARDPRTHKQDVHVSIVGSTILLGGQTTTEERREAIGAVVGELAGGRAVRNDVVVLVVSPPGDAEVVHD